MRRARRPRIVDLTRTITDEMPNFPGEPRPGFIRFGDLDDIGFRLHPTDYRRVHVILFRGNVAVVEGLVRLGEVGASRFFLVALPLPFAGLDGSPVRALAIVGDPSAL